MKELPKSKLTEYQFRVLGDNIAYSVLNGRDPRQQPFTCDGRIGSRLFKKGFIEIEPNQSKNGSPVWLITDAGIQAYWDQKNPSKKGENR